MSVMARKQRGLPLCILPTCLCELNASMVHLRCNKDVVLIVAVICVVSLSVPSQ